MVHDYERRKAAAKLRGLHPRDKSWWGISGFDWEWFADELFEAIGYDTSGHDEWTDRLADLIEPDEPKVKCVAEVKVDGEQLEQLVHDAAVELTGIDRDALLALADDIDKQTDGSMFDAWLEDGHYIARRIREALGVE